MRKFYLFVLLVGLCHGVSKASECSKRGRFPNINAADCRGYTMCLLGGLNGFTQYKLTCPEGFVYSHLEQQCTNSTSYQCLPNFVCNTTGQFPITNGNCLSYAACVEGVTDLVTARQVACPKDHVFNPDVRVCVNATEYKCNDPEPTTVTDSPTIQLNVTIEDICTDANDTCRIGQNNLNNTAIDVQHNTTNFEKACLNATDYNCDSTVISKNLTDLIGTQFNITDIKVQASSENGFHLSVNGACKREALLFTFVILVNFI